MAASQKRALAPSVDESRNAKKSKTEEKEFDKLWREFAHEEVNKCTSLAELRDWAAEHDHIAATGERETADFATRAKMAGASGAVNLQLLMHTTNRST
jgi:hypothetical protein